MNKIVIHCLSVGLKVCYNEKEEQEMIYGTLTKAKEFADAGKIDEWMQLFLRNDGKNLKLADGLLLEERYYLGLIEIDIELLADVKAGVPEYLHDQDSIDYFFHIVDNMKEVYENWDTPPLIVEYVHGKFQVNDGRHRLEMYRQLNVKNITIALWTTGEENYKKLLEEVFYDRNM